MSGWLRTLCAACALAVLGCGPGDHETSSFVNLFRRAGAGGNAAATRAASAAGIGVQPNLNAPGPAPAPSTAPAPIPTPEVAGQMAGASEAPNPITANVTAGVTAITPMAGSSAPAPPPVDPSKAGPCSPGQVAIAGQCVCDLNGVFAFHGRSQVMLTGMAPLEGLTDASEQWGVVRQRYDAQGTLELALSACGQTSVDICVGAQPPVITAAEAYAQYVPVETWDKAFAPAKARVSFPNALPGARFATPAIAQLFGIALTDPLGAWPMTRRDIEGSTEFDGSGVNGARWLDVDADGQLGMTVAVVAPGGVVAAANSGPIQSYGATSSKCPRSNPQAARSPYAYLPLPQGLGVKRIKRFYSAQRVMLEFHGTLDTCDKVSGTLTGAGAGQLSAEVLFGGCALVNGASESACTSALLDVAETSGGGSATGLELTGGTFVLVRVRDDVTCSQVRAMKFD